MSVREGYPEFYKANRANPFQWQADAADVQVVLRSCYIPFSSNNVLLQWVPTCQKWSMSMITLFDSANILCRSNNTINFAA